MHLLHNALHMLCTLLYALVQKCLVCFAPVTLLPTLTKIYLLPIHTPEHMHSQPDHLVWFLLLFIYLFSCAHFYCGSEFYVCYTQQV